jgi:hypothetical protein
MLMDQKLDGASMVDHLDCHQCFGSRYIHSYYHQRQPLKETGRRWRHQGTGTRRPYLLKLGAPAPFPLLPLLPPLPSFLPLPPPSPFPRPSPSVHEQLQPSSPAPQLPGANLPLPPPLSGHAASLQIDWKLGIQHLARVRHGLELGIIWGKNGAHLKISGSNLPRGWLGRGKSRHHRGSTRRGIQRCWRRRFRVGAHAPVVLS